LGFSLWARYGLIESVSVATQCNATFVPFSCTVRNFVIASTVLPFWGYMALAAGVFALLLRRFDLTLLALVAGSVGVVLYAGATAAVGLLLGWITLARLLAQAPVAKQ
jgi:small-conductance mechanosensitive channel